MSVRGSSRWCVSQRVTFVPVLMLIVVTVTLAVPGIAFAVFSAAPAGQSAGVTAATISPPSTFTATATGASTASLSWSGPATKTGYTLTQSPGTLAGAVLRARRRAAPRAQRPACPRRPATPGR